MLELYKNIKKYRIALGMSQDELAKKAGYTDRSSIAKIEKGAVNLPQSKILQFARIFGITASELMGNDGIVQIDEPSDPDLLAMYKMYQVFDQTDKDEIIAIMRIKMRKYM